MITVIALAVAVTLFQAVRSGCNTLETVAACVGVVFVVCVLGVLVWLPQ